MPSLLAGRKLGKRLVFISVMELQRNGTPHLHMLVGSYLPKKDWISKAWELQGGGRQTRIEYADVHRVSAYLAKYFTDDPLINPDYRKIWRYIDRVLNPANPKGAFDCSTQAFAALSILQQLGRDARIGFAHATYDDRAGGPNGLPIPSQPWDALTLKVGAYPNNPAVTGVEDKSRLLWFTDGGERGSGQSYEAFVLDYPTFKAYTLLPFGGPFSSDILDLSGQANHGPDLRVALRVMFETLSAYKQAGRNPDQRWAYGLTPEFLSGPIAFPIPLP